MSGAKSRLEARVTFAQLMGLYTLWCSAISLSFHGLGVGAVKYRLPALWISLAAILLGCWTARHGSRKLVAGCLAALALESTLFMQEFSRPGRDEATRLLAIALGPYLIAAFATFVLALPGKLSYLKIGIGTSATASALVIAIVLFLRPVVREVPLAPGPALDPRASEFIQNEIIWIGSPSRPHPELEHQYAPFAVFKTAYPSDPRRYLEPEPIYGALDARVGDVMVDAGMEASIDRPKGRFDSWRIQPRQADASRPWRIKLHFNQVPLRAERGYRVRFKARAERPRNLIWTVAKGAADWSEFARRFQHEIPSAEVEISETFVATQTEPNAGPVFFVAGDTAWIEISELTLAPVEGIDEGPLDPREWRVLTEGGARASALPLESPLRGVRLEFGASAGNERWDAQLEQTGLRVTATVGYNLSFRVRSSRPRKTQVVLITNRAPFTQLGLGQEFDSDREWRAQGFAFQSMASESDAKLVFNAGGSTDWLELADVRLWRESLQPPPPAPMRYSATYQLNSLGFRDHEHTADPPANVIRIACLGDSYTFGQGTRQEDTFVRRIETILNDNSAGQGPRYETMNFGVCGYCTRQERICYERIASTFKPTIALLTMVHNDNLSYEEEKKLGLHRPEGAPVELLQDIAERTRRMFANNVGYDVCAKEVKKLDQVCKDRGCKLVVVLYQDSDADNWRAMEKAVVKGMEGTGIPLLNLRADLATIPFSALKVHELDGHPNEVSHGIAARRIVEFLREQKIVSAD